MSDLTDDLKNYLNTEEGKKSVTKFVQSQIFLENVYKPKWVGKIKEKIDQHGEDYVIEKLIQKYNSDEYRDREYKMGREPDEVLLYYLLYYGRKYCKLSDDEKDWTSFVAEVYHVGSYSIKLLIGQGSGIIIKKME